MKLVAVCPEGKELSDVPSGRGLRTVYFTPFTTAVMTATEKASETAILPHELRLSYPHILSPSVRAAGAYCV